MKKWLTKVKLKGDIVELIPLKKAHKKALLAAAADGELWKLWYTSVPSKETIDQYLETALADQKEGKALAFVVVLIASGEVIGTTRFCKATPQHRRVEIGYTWYAQRFQRTGVNTECKYLMLKHAFENLDAIAVQFMTHWHNFSSRTAILRLGAKQDGVIRNHRIGQGGVIRDTVLFSIIRDEWKSVKKSLKFQMEKYQN